MNTTCKLTLWGFDVDVDIEFTGVPGDIDITSVQVYGCDVPELSDKGWARVVDACEDRLFELSHAQ